MSRLHRLKSYQVLVVDNSLFNLVLLQKILESEGYPVKTANSAKDALAKLQTFPIDLILLDTHLPDISGYELIPTIRRIENLRDVPIILVTISDREDAEQGLTLGANDFIFKPFKIDDVLMKVKNYCF